MRPILLICFLLLSCLLPAQSDKGLYPSETKAQVIILLRDYARKPIPKADVWLEDTEGRRIAEGKTNASGMWETLAPNGRTYWIGIEDSARSEQVTLEAKAHLITRRTVFFQGTVNGKPTIVASPSFNMMPPPDGQAKVDFSFIRYDQSPLVGEIVTMTALGSGKQYNGGTDSSGCLQMRVPIGENYRVSLKYSPEFDRLDFPAHGGSYTVRLRYGYAGSLAIENARRQRALNDSLHNAYRLVRLEEQRKMRDSTMHKKVFKAVEVQTMAGAEAAGEHSQQSLPGGQMFSRPTPMVPFKTGYGFSISMSTASAMSCPLYMDGLIITGGGFSSASIHAFDANTGELKWTVRLGEGGPCAPTGANGVVIVITESCTLYAIDAKSGKLLWSKWLSPYVLSAPAILDEQVFVAYEDKDGGQLLGDAGRSTHALASFDLRSGAINWQQWVYGEVMSSIVADAGRVFCNTFNGHSYVLDARSGRVIATAMLLATSAPTPGAGLLYMSQRESLQGTPRERIAAFDAATLNLKAAGPWQDATYLDWGIEGKSKQSQAEAAMSLSSGLVYNAMDDSHSRRHAQALAGVETVAGMQMYQGSRPLIAAGNVIAAIGGNLRAYSVEGMRLVWEWKDKAAPYTGGGRQYAPPILAGEKLFMAGCDGTMRSFYPRTGKPVDIYRTEEEMRSQPIAVNGWLFAGAVNGKLVAINTGDPLVDGWDCWGGNWGRTNAN